MPDVATIGCWRCGAAVPLDLLPLRREEVCPTCNADLHVCKLCTFYNPAVSDACDEPIAASVGNKERANFCDYFKPSARAYKGGAGGDQARARAELDALFGGAPPEPRAGAVQSELEKLFGLGDTAGQSRKEQGE